ncbi:hypothetical protein HGRIS_011583 [Hohenbuehelia grisea]|uniref:NADH:flavin oxidoreductase/NADH oxidase N-terminal domain-containing protein n=1 Tax=Hohenbuehelia grisea TaxID=104357 RepID=A0ABR3JXA3_9AGAR
MDDHASETSLALFSPITLPCGRQLPNRLVKVALYEHLANLRGGPPNSYHNALYSRWAQGGWGMVLTGNVQVSGEHLSLGRDTVIPPVVTEASLKPFKELASSMHGSSPLAEAERGTSPLAIMQLSHGGRQSPNLIGGRFPFASPLGPSSIRVGSSVQHGSFLGNAFYRFLFQEPKPMTLDQISDVVAAFVRGARLAAQAGFDGVQIHAAHGYLLAQFLSPKSNTRTDEYACDNALQLVRRIVDNIRLEVPESFVVGIKLNVADYTDTTGTSPADRALAHITSIAAWGTVDFIELSGGDYEDVAFMNKPQSAESSDSPRQALFTQCAHDAMRSLEGIERNSEQKLPLILLTGGFRTPAQMHAALSAHHTDLIGIGRSAIVCTDLPKRLRSDIDANTEAVCQQPAVETRVVKPTNRLSNWLWSKIPKVKLVGSGVEVAWYELALRRIAEAVVSSADGEATPEFDFDLGNTKILVGMWLWRAPR